MPSGLRGSHLPVPQPAGEDTEAGGLTLSAGRMSGWLSTLRPSLFYVDLETCRWACFSTGGWWGWQLRPSKLSS